MPHSITMQKCDECLNSISRIYKQQTCASAAPLIASQLHAQFIACYVAIRNCNK